MARVEAKFDNTYALNTYAVLDVSTTQEAEYNRSKVTWTLSIEVRKWSGYSNNQWIASSSAVVTGNLSNVVINTPVQSYRVYGNASGSGSAVVSSGSFYHYHDSNGNGGTKTLNISVKPNSDYIQNQPTLNLSTNLSFGTINVHKTSDFGSYPSSIFPNSTYSLNIVNSNSSMASGYTHKIYLSVNSDKRLLGTKYGVGSFNFSVPSDIENSISGTSQSAYFQILTQNGSTDLGSTFRTTTITRTTTLKPTLRNSGFSHSEGNISIRNMQLNGYVAGLSKINLILNDGAVSYPSGGTKSRFNVYLYYGESLIRTETTTGTSVTFNVDSRAINTLASIKISVTDSKGYTSDFVTLSGISIIGYSAPTAKGTVVRSTSNQTTVNLRAAYTLTPISVNGAIKNKLTIQTQSRTGSNGWNTITNLTTSNLAGNGSYNKDIPNVSTANSLEYRLVLNDGLSTVYVVLGSTGTEKVPLDISKTGVGVGKFHSDGSYNLEVGAGGIKSEGIIENNVGAVLGYSNNFITAGANLNSFTTQGVYAMASNYSVYNHPTGRTDRFVMEVYNVGGEYVFQIAFVSSGDSANSKAMIRKAYRGSWEKWQPLGGEAATSNTSQYGSDDTSKTTIAQLWSPNKLNSMIDAKIPAVPSFTEYNINNEKGYFRLGSTLVCFGYSQVSKLLPGTSATYYADISFSLTFKYGTKPFVVTTPLMSTPNSSEVYIRDVTNSNFRSLMYGNTLTSSMDKKMQYIAIGRYPS